MMVHRFCFHFETRNMIGLYVVYVFLSLCDGSGINLVQIGLEKIGDSKNFTLSYHVDENQDILIVLQSKGDEMLDCFILGDRKMINKILKGTSTTNHFTENDEKMKNLSKICEEGKSKGLLTGGNIDDVIKKFGKFNALFIVPGTKWCGAGNISDNYNDLGPEEETDKCCRTHDYCSDSISAFSSKYGLKNESPATRSNCECDNKLHNCLMESGNKTSSDTKTSNTVGRLYFNVLQMPCFRKDYPIKSCKKYEDLLHRRCVEYELDYSKEKKYQFFDAQSYVPISKDEEEECSTVICHLLQLEKTNELINIL